MGAEHPILARGASGLRHLRWAREVLGTLHGFAEHEGYLSEVQRGVLRGEVERVTGLVGGLSAAVKPYRDFLERTRTRARGRLRVAEFLVAGAPELGSPPDGVAAGAIHDAVVGEIAAVIEPEREALRWALRLAIEDIRAGLRAMDEQLGAVFSLELVNAIYPELAPDGMRVLDDGDPDDDSAGSAAGA